MEELNKVKCQCGHTEDPDGNCDGSHEKLVKDGKAKQEDKSC